MFSENTSVVQPSGRYNRFLSKRIINGIIISGYKLAMDHFRL